MGTPNFFVCPMKTTSLLASLTLVYLAFAAPALDAQFITLNATASALTGSNTSSSQFQYDSVNGYSSSAGDGGYVGTPSTTVPGQYTFSNLCGMSDGVNPITQKHYGASTTTSVSIPTGKIRLFSSGKEQSGGNTLGEWDDAVTFRNPGTDPVVLNVTFAINGTLSRISDTNGVSRSQFDARFAFNRGSGPYTTGGATLGNSGSVSAHYNSDGLSQTNTFDTGNHSPVDVNFPAGSVGGSVVIHITLLPGDTTFNVTENMSINTNESAIADFSRGVSMKFDLPAGVTYTSASGLLLTAHPEYFQGEAALSNGVYYLAFTSGNPFGYYSYLSDQNYIYHQDLGYEYVFDADDGANGLYLYDFKSGGFFYTAPAFPFPYLYDFTLGTVLYYYPDPSNPGRYNTSGHRYFYRFDTGAIIEK